MKNLTRSLFFLFLIVFSIVACEDDVVIKDPCAKIDQVCYKAEFNPDRSIKLNLSWTTDNVVHPNQSYKIILTTAGRELFNGTTSATSIIVPSIGVTTVDQIIIISQPCEDTAVVGPLKIIVGDIQCNPGTGNGSIRP